MRTCESVRESSNFNLNNIQQRRKNYRELFKKCGQCDVYLKAIKNQAKMHK